MKFMTKCSSRRAIPLVLAIVVGCGEDLQTANVPNLTGPSFNVVESSGQGVLVGNGTMYLDCIGEVGILHSEIPYRFHQVVTPSGNATYSDSFIPGEATGTILGQTTGRLWTLQRAISPEVVQSNSAGEISFFTTNNWFTSETGPTLNFHNTLRFHQNPSGEIIVDSFEIHCITH